MARKRTTKKGAAKKSRARKSAAKPKRGRKGNSPAMAMPAKRAERGEEALSLREQGLSWNAIGKKLGISGSYARNCAADYAGGKSKLPPLKAK